MSARRAQSTRYERFASLESNKAAQSAAHVLRAPHAASGKQVSCRVS
jgi:hypothetical protein